MSQIQWTDVVWNPTVGCSRVSAGCEHCYAERFAHRGLTEVHRGLTVAGPKGPRWTGKVRLVPEVLAKPLRWRKPRRIFVNSMSDLFHEAIPFEYIAAVFGVMAASPQHTFQVLTKRPERMRAFFAWLEEQDGGPMTHAAYSLLVTAEPDLQWPIHSKHCPDPDGPWPLPNVWIGVSAENQATADERIPLLLQCPAAVRFVSAEPLLGPVDFRFLQPDDPPTEIDALAGTHGVIRPHRGTCARLDWLIVGGESGSGARSCDVAWIRSIVEQCRDAEVACFVKQLGAVPYDSAAGVEVVPGEARAMARAGYLTGNGYALPLRDRKGGDLAKFPEDLRVREFPKVTR